MGILCFNRWNTDVRGEYKLRCLHTVLRLEQLSYRALRAFMGVVNSYHRNIFPERGAV